MLDGNHTAAPVPTKIHTPSLHCTLKVCSPKQLHHSLIAGMTISCGSLVEDLRLLQLPASQTMMLEALTVSQPRVVRNTSKLLEVRRPSPSYSLG